MKRCIIVQGPTYSNSINQIKDCWKGYDVIYSTWKGYESWYGDGDIAIFSHTPHESGTKNLNYQKISTLAGLEMAKQLGYERALKWRSDMWTNNAKGLLDTFKDGYNTLCWVDSEGGYLSDFFMEDTVDNLITLWDIHPNGRFPEIVLTDKVKELGWLNRINFIVSDLNEDVDIYWNSRHGAYWMNGMNKEAQYKSTII